MTNGEMMTQIGEAAMERKISLDKMSCYEDRLKTALQALAAFLDPDKNHLHEDNMRILSLSSDPRADAKGYIEAKMRADDRADFLKKHNAL